MKETQTRFYAVGGDGGGGATDGPELVEDTWLHKKMIKHKNIARVAIALAGLTLLGIIYVLTKPASHDVKQETKVKPNKLERKVVNFKYPYKIEGKGDFDYSGTEDFVGVNPSTGEEEVYFGFPKLGANYKPTGKVQYIPYHENGGLRSRLMRNSPSDVSRYDARVKQVVKDYKARRR